MRTKGWYPERHPEFNEAGNFEAAIFASDRPRTSGKSIAAFSVSLKGTESWPGNIFASEGRSEEYRGYTAAACGVVESLQPNSTIDIYTHHDTTFRAFTEYLPRWQLNGWIASGRKPVIGAEIYQRFVHVTETRNIHWKFFLIGPWHPRYFVVEALKKEVGQRFRDRDEAA